MRRLIGFIIAFILLVSLLFVSSQYRLEAEVYGKLLFEDASFAAVTLLSGYNYMQNNNEMTLSDLALANVEALANGESGEYAGCYSGPGFCSIWVNGNCIFASDKHYPR